MFQCFCLKKKKNIKLSKHAAQIAKKIKPNQLELLQLIFEDLAQRHIDTKINQENFLSFFQLNGMWGHRLFSSFDSDHNNLLNFQQFIFGILNYVKTDRNNQVQYLYKFFENDNSNGIEYNQFVKMLFCYPKKELKKIFNDKDFFDNIIVQKLKKQCKIELQNTGGTPNKQIKKLRLDQSHYLYQNTNMNTKKKPFATIFKKINQSSLKESIVFQIQDRKYNLQSRNFNSLVKIFAKKIYDDYKIDLQKGRLNLQQFKDWISKHPLLFNSYYSTFHNYIWQTINQKPSYMVTPTEFQSKAKLLIDDNYKNIYLLLIHTTIIVCSKQNKQNVKKIICLQGLNVNSIEQNNGFGILISHRDGIYRPKKIIFKTKELQQKWLQCLKCFKGVTIQQKYNIGQQIGSGKFSIVYKCTKKISSKDKHLEKKQQQFAIKVIETYKLTQQQKKCIENQSANMNFLNFPNIIRLIEKIQTKTHLYLVTELAKGVDLFDYITKSKNPIRQYDAALIITQIIKAVKYLHSLGMVHRDIKAENVMVILKDNDYDKVEKVKLIDFGLTNYLRIMKQNNKEVLGTPNYIAPQVLTTGYGDYKIDNFAIGVLMFFMLRGCLPFDSDFSDEIIQNTIDCEYDLDDYVWKTVSNSAKELIKKFLKKNPEQRISLQQAQRHQWFFKQDPNEPKKIINHYRYR